MYYVSNRGTFIKLDDITAIAPSGNMGSCEVHLKGGSVITMNDHKGLLLSMEKHLNYNQIETKE